MKVAEWLIFEIWGLIPETCSTHDLGSDLCDFFEKKLILFRLAPHKKVQESPEIRGSFCEEVAGSVQRCLFGDKQ